MRRLLALAVIFAALSLAGCADETVYDWQRPHETYQVGSFSKYQNAEALKSELQKNGFDSRIETDIKNGQFYLNVLVDVYDHAPDTLARLERVSGVKPALRGPKSDKAAPATAAPAVPAKDI
ncbi:SPOR domain-containing protein [Solidesulfovibrio sp.]|uniref:SPOR domain-containing protein n=1 Tax=Solidesulfovibrio sp. TaxID=2910990 RepID=UPI000EC9E53F|nr:SPOR domain-containing protein [Solidesulfovibrio sp.]MEA5087628.1 SPOR domain-containing protein [Solidesulfovibrio sp.]HCR13752.1 SPOR domain-containing protein [Desulfovibrio sp.]HML61777.1 SPOR domain-containing protein [Solidesulfovibrio sp.]